jgi:hypothetical protein
MLSRIILAVVVAVVAYLICIFVGGVLLVSLGVPIAVAVGRFLVQWATVISVLAGLWFFFAGGGFGPIRLR